MIHFSFKVRSFLRQHVKDIAFAYLLSLALGLLVGSIALKNIEIGVFAIAPSLLGLILFLAYRESKIVLDLRNKDEGNRRDFHKQKHAHDIAAR